MYTVYKMKNELGEEVELVEKKEFDKILKCNQEAIVYIVRELIEINKHQYVAGSRRLKKVLATLQGKEGASNCE